MAKALEGLLLSLGGMSTTNPKPTNQIQRFLYSLAKGLSNTFDSAPPPGTPTVGTPDLNTGTVTGSLGFATGTGLTFTHSQPSQGTVTVASDGTYIYTPNQAARQAATATTTDTFTATVHEGLSTNSVTVTVPVDPGTPVAGTPTVGSPNVSTGVVTGNAVFTDTAGRTLTYTPGDQQYPLNAPPPITPNGPVFTSTSNGGGTVTLNYFTGVFTYMPSEAQRQTATATTTDTFTVTAFNSVRTATETVTVPVDPGALIAGTPTVSNPNTETGVITGRAVFTDTAGRTLTYSTPATSSGGGTVSIDTDTGAYAYTPTQAQRQTATSTTIDTFTVTAFNGVRSSSETVTVPVLPATPTVAPSTPTVTATIPVGQSPTSVALSPDGSKLYVTNLTDNTLSAVDTATNTVLWTATSSTVGHTPGAVAVRGDGGVYVVNMSDGTISLIYGQSTSGGTINVGGRPDGIALGSSGYAYVIKVPANNSQYGTITAIYSPTGAVLGSTTVGPVGTYPQAIAYSNSGIGTRLYVASVPSKAGSYGTLTVYRVTEYLNSTPYIAPPTLQTVATIPVGTPGNFPVAVAVSRDGSHVYVANSTDGSVSVVDASTDAVTGTIPVGAGPEQMAISPDGTRLYVTNGGSNTVSVINTSTNTVVNTVPVGTRPQGIAVSPDGSHVYVANSGSNTVSVITV
ncbi:beta-propeller fold lactonase family protein [Mycolicibacterium pallens]|uniref:Beta-propeller fold lactonase family protein n=2 Tax=Mycolicibacterium pallens TaxID=370524 RepID=A0ABX8VLK7_9MYCO|nr:beta-propeller fold lactonase family protein [Mycolicibacterium pallens]